MNRFGFVLACQMALQFTTSTNIVDAECFSCSNCQLSVSCTFAIELHMLTAPVAKCQVPDVQVISQVTDCVIKAVKPKGH